jgi:hypothetical protein
VLDPFSRSAVSAYFFVNIECKTFDASGWPVRPSGLAWPVRLCPMANLKLR